MNILKTTGAIAICAIIIYTFSVYLKISPEPRIRGAQPLTTIPSIEEKLISVPQPVAHLASLSLSAQSALSVHVNKNVSTILFEKSPDLELPIASITKLMTAVLIQEKLDPASIITISADAIAQYETAGKLKEGQRFTVTELLYPLLIESSNDVAYAFAEEFEKKNIGNLVHNMNIKANELGMTDTVFNNASGLDRSGGNYSSASDLLKLVTYIVEKHPELLDITSLESYQLITSEGTYNEILTSTNKSLTDNRIPFTIIGGKTGETPLAKQTLLLVTKSPQVGGYIVSIILNSEMRHDDMADLINWVNTSYTW